MADRQDADSPWKSILRTYFPEAIEFFFPDIAKTIDWQIPPVFLDKEFQQLSPNAEVGKRYADQLVQVKLKRGKLLILLLHLEIQANKEIKFEERMLTYALRIYDFFHQPACSLAILCDSNAKWRPQKYILATPGSKLTFEFTTIKLLDYQEQWSELASSLNPFATVVMAHLQAQKTKNQAPERKNMKFQLVRGLYEKGYNRSQVLDLFRFIDWIMALPEDLDNIFWNDLKVYEKEKKMTYVTSVEKIGFKRGQQETQKKIEKIALNMLQKGMSVEDIALLTELSISQVKRLAKEQVSASQSSPE